MRLPHQKKLKKLRHRHKPAVQLRQTPHQPLEDRMDLTIPARPAGKVGVHNADSRFRRQPLLIRFSDHVAKLRYIPAFARAEPEVDERLSGVMVGKGRIDALKIDLIENKIAHETDSIPADIAPEVPSTLQVA